SSSPSCAAVPAMQMAEDKLRTTCDPSAGFLWSTVSHRSNALANVLEGCPSGLWCLIRNQMCESTGGSNPSPSARIYADPPRRDDRVAEGARLEIVCTERYRGFESLSLRV